MNEHDFRKLFPRASSSTVALNTSLPASESQPDAAKPLEDLAKGEKKVLERFAVCITSRRVRPLDPDNLAGSTKDLVDGLRHFGVINDDTPFDITLNVRQEKVGRYKDEQTVVEVVML